MTKKRAKPRSLKEGPMSELDRELAIERRWRPRVAEERAALHTPPWLFTPSQVRDEAVCPYPGADQELIDNWKWCHETWMSYPPHLKVPPKQEGEDG